MKVAILCGGLGSRIKNYYPNTIKSLINFNNIPFIFYQLAVLYKNRLTDIVLCSGYGNDELRTTIKSMEIFLKNYTKMNVVIYPDGDVPLGTGGSIKRALPLLGDKFGVLYGDSYLDFNYGETINKFYNSHKLGLMTLYHNQNIYGKSNVEFDGKQLLSYNKISSEGEYIDYGFNLFDASAFNGFSKNFDLSSVIQELIVKREMDYDIIPNRFYEIGSIEGIQDLEKRIKNENFFSRLFI